MSTQVSERVDYELASGPGARARIGLIVLENDLSMEPEFAAFSHCDGVAVYSSRIEMDNDTTPETLRAMYPRIGAVTERLAAVGHLDVVGFCCTSGSMAIGPQRIAQAVNDVLPEAKVTTPVTAALSALAALQARRIGLITPYIDDINAEVSEYLKGQGLEIARFRSFGIRDGIEIAHVDPESLVEAARPFRQEGIDALFVSCTGLLVSPVLAELEDVVGKPIVSSNQAMAWHALRLAGITDDVPQVGRYLSKLQAPIGDAIAAE